MKFWVGLFTSLILQVVSAQSSKQYRTGDLLFQNLDCGALCDAIETVTKGNDGLLFSHIGLVVVEKDSVWVIEAIGQKVQRTPLATFTKRTTHPTLQARLKPEYTYLVKPAMVFALAQLNTPYDDAFLYNNQKYYCSELIYDAFKTANNNEPVFSLQPMTFNDPATQKPFAAWVNYYKELGIPIPEGEPGINPAGIARSSYLQWIP
ncbi:MAG: hypothetical protein MUE96_00535 [Bacteroidia bacterium]|jgi:hypothetical protein|nr:hypothetical protein [Bacteroidia bacterium]